MSESRVLIGNLNSLTFPFKALVHDREIVVFRTGNGKLYAIDERCYHGGGPLSRGRLVEIEDLPGRPCVECPWHGYKILLDSGESVLTTINPMSQPLTSRTISKGLRQRVHLVEEEEGKVYVTLKLGGEKIPSDFYSSEEYKKIMQGRRTRTSDTN